LQDGVIIFTHKLAFTNYIEKVIRHSERKRKHMVQITIQIDGMMCGMCESHLSNAIRTAFSVKRVTASHRRGRIVIVAEETIDEAALRKVVSDTGYTAGQITQAPYEKKRLFHRD